MCRIHWYCYWAILLIFISPQLPPTILWFKYIISRILKIKINPKFTSSSCSSISKKQTTQSKNGQKTQIDICPKKIYRLPTNA